MSLLEDISKGLEHIQKLNKPGVLFIGIVIGFVPGFFFSPLADKIYWKQAYESISSYRDSLKIQVDELTKKNNDMSSKVLNYEEKLTKYVSNETYDKLKQELTKITRRKI
jgi:hypothetical protein